MTPLSAAVDRAVEILRRAQRLASDDSYAHGLDAIADAVVGISDLHASLVGPSGSTMDLTAARATLDDKTATLDAIERGPMSSTAG
jgi:hypothetical protein